MNRLDLVIRAAKNPEARLFCAYVLSKSYLHHDILDLIMPITPEKILISLSQARGVKALKALSKEYYLSLFKSKSAKSKKLNTAYHDYKNGRKTDVEKSIYEPLLVGRNIFNLGPGLSRLSSALSTNMRTIIDYDVVDYQTSQITSKKTSLSKFLNMTIKNVGQIETSIIKSTLHHIDARLQVAVLRTLLTNTSNRVIVCEEFFDMQDSYVATFFSQSSKNSTLIEFASLKESAQFDALVIFDYFGNQIFGGHDIMNMPFSFRKLKDWVCIIEQHKFRLKNIIPLSFPDFMLHTSNHAIMVFDKE